MFDKLHTPEEIFSFKLGGALTMEHTSLKLLQELQEKTNRAELRELFAAHEAETRQHISNIERSFDLLGEEVETNPSPAIEGLAKEGESSLKKIDDAIIDAGILAGANEVEHHEIAVYETLVNNAHARGAEDVANLLQQNLNQEKTAVEKISAAAHRIAREGYAVAKA
jgi:ferritin-like metal-binding protein YciE